MRTIKAAYKKIANAVRPVLLSIVALFLAGVITTVFPFDLHTVPRSIPARSLDVCGLGR